MDKESITFWRAMVEALQKPPVECRHGVNPLGKWKDGATQFLSIKEDDTIVSLDPDGKVSEGLLAVEIPIDGKYKNDLENLQLASISVAMDDIFSGYTSGIIGVYDKSSRGSLEEKIPKAYVMILTPEEYTTLAAQTIHQLSDASMGHKIIDDDNIKGTTTYKRAFEDANSKPYRVLNQIITSSEIYGDEKLQHIQKLAFPAFARAIKDAAPKPDPGDDMPPSHSR